MMEITGNWTKDEEGYMDFDSSQVQRYYESITDQYHQVYNQYLEEFDDEEDAHYNALADGYEMVTDYKDVNGVPEFVTTYHTPAYTLDVWYDIDPDTNKKDYNRGFIKIFSK